MPEFFSIIGKKESKLMDFSIYLGFLWSDSVNREATFDVIDQTEVLVRLFDLHDI